MGSIGEWRADPNVPGTCPRCLGPLPVGYFGALSRADNATEVCSACGTDEAMCDAFGGGIGGHLADPAKDWPISVADGSIDTVDGRVRFVHRAAVGLDRELRHEKGES